MMVKVKPLKLLFFLVLVIALLIAGYILRGYIYGECVRLETFVRQSGSAAPIYFILLSTIGLVFFIPRTTFLILAGVFFGTTEGVIYSYLASFFSALISFYFARSRLRSVVIPLLHKRKWFWTLEALSHKYGILFVILSRNIRAHFALINLACGVLRIGTFKFLLGSFIGLLPGTIGTCYAASLLGCKLLDPKEDIPFHLIWKFLLVSILLNILSLAPILWDRYKKKKSR